MQTDHEPITGTPRWVKVFGIIATILAVLFVIILITGIGGPHGPGRHTPPTNTGSLTPAEGGD